MRVLALASAVVLVAACSILPAGGQVDDGVGQAKPRPPKTPAKTVSNGHFGMFYSFVHPVLASMRFTWEESEVICNYFGMTLASLQDEKKHFKVARLMAVLKVDGVWTSGSRSYYDFYWGGGEPLSFSKFKGWSRTGAYGLGQPDNAGGDENCLSVLNNAYGDGITWHDVNCGVRMAFVCEAFGDK